MKKTLYKFAKIMPKKESFEKAKEIVEGIIEDTRNEDGCLLFELYASDDNRDLFLYEEWQDNAALGRHFEYEHTKAALNGFHDYLRQPTEVTSMYKVK